MRLWGLFSFCLILSACASKAVVQPQNLSQSKTEVQGHRGARWVRPENTMSAFKYAVAEGVDTIELDLHVSKDGVLVITHDPFINPEFCVDEAGKPARAHLMIRKMKFSEIEKYDCGSVVNPRFPNQVAQPKERIPKFEDLLLWLKTSPSTVRLNVETKSDPKHPEYTPGPHAFTKQVIDMLKKYGFIERTTLESFDERSLLAVRDIEPKLKTSVLVEDRPSTPLTAVSARVKADILSPDYQWLTREDVEALHQSGVRVIPWTVNDPMAWQRMIALGVDGLITDNPQALLEFLHRK